MHQRVQAQGPQGIQVQFLDVVRGGLQHHLELVVVLQTVGVFPVTAVGGTAAGLNVGRIPGLRTDGPQEGGRVEGTGAHFHIQGLENHAAVLRPEILQSQDQTLEGLDIRRGVVRCLVCHDVCLLIQSVCGAPIILRGTPKKGALYACQCGISKWSSLR